MKGACLPSGPAKETTEEDELPLFRADDLCRTVVRVPRLSNKRATDLPHFGSCIHRPAPAKAQAGKAALQAIMLDDDEVPESRRRSSISLMTRQKDAKVGIM